MVSSSSTCAEKRYLTPRETAAILMISPAALRRCAVRGDLPATTTPGGHRRFLRTDVEQYLHARGGAAESAEAAVQLVAETAPATLRVLVITESQERQTAIRRVLEAQNERVTVKSSSDAFDAGMKVLDFEPDAVVVDADAHAFAPAQVARHLRSIGRPIRLIALDGNARAEAEGLSVGAGALIDERDLLEQLGLHAAGRGHASLRIVADQPAPDPRVEALKRLPRELFRATKVAEGCTQGGEFAVSERSCWKCDDRAECIDLGTNTLDTRDVGPSGALRDALETARQFVDRTVQAWGHVPHTCRCDACTWLVELDERARNEDQGQGNK